MNELTEEIKLDTSETLGRVSLRKPVNGSVGRHDVPGLRGYRVIRFAHREQFAFSTLSLFVLELMASVYVDKTRSRFIWSGPVTASA